MTEHSLQIFDKCTTLGVCAANTGLLGQFEGRLQFAGLGVMVVLVLVGVHLNRNIGAAFVLAQQWQTFAGNRSPVVDLVPAAPPPGQGLSG